MKTNSSEDRKDPGKPGAMLDLHRKTVESSTGMSSAFLLGSGFALAMGLFAWLGHQWDERNGTAPWGVLAGVGLGFLYGAYEVWKITRPLPGDTASAGKDDGDETAS